MSTLIKQTAIDYDMDIEDVVRIYEESFSKDADFYELLEKFIKDRADA